MNKKFSTLLAVGLLAGGALLGNVDAKEASSVELTTTAVNVSTIKPSDIGHYERADGTSDKVLLILNRQATKSYNDGAGTTYTCSSYNPDNTSERREAALFHWTFTPVETSLNNYELRLKDSYEAYMVVDGNYVTVDCVVSKVNGKWKFNGADTYPTDLTLKSGGKFVKYSIRSGFTTTTTINEAQQVATAKIGIAQMYASDLLQRFGEYFTLDIAYNKDQEDEADLTGLFKGSLKPMERVSYANGKATYTEADPYDTRFMLVNEDGKILVINTSDGAAYSTTEGEQVYPFELITPKQWAEDVLPGGDRIYKAAFSVNYTPGQDPLKVSTIESLEVSGSWGYTSTVGCWLSKGLTPNLAAGANITKLKPVTITLNKTSAVVDAKKWLNQVAYYTVEVANKNTNATHFGKVLGLNQYGQAAYVDPAKTDITKPEGQFAIAYSEDGKYVFTNRETLTANEFTLDADNLYKIDATTFAYKEKDGYGKYHMDTLSITPVKDFTSADGFKRFVEKDLNANTYTMAMNLLDDSYLYAVENHDDKHRIGLDREAATNWRIEMPTVMLKDATWDDVRLIPDTVTVPVYISYYDADGNLRTTAKSNKKYYNPNTELKICTYILKNIATAEYISGMADAEETGNDYYYCPEKNEATRFALKMVGDSTINLVPVYTTAKRDKYGKDWKDGIELSESAYAVYAEELALAGQKVIGGTTSKTGVLKDVNRFDAVSNDLFVIATAAAPTYKQLDQDNKISLSRIANNDHVIYEQGEFASIDNIKAYNMNPTVYVDTAYVNREGNYRYEYLLGVNINRIDETDSCNIPSHEHLRTVITEGRFLVNMMDSALANKNVHVNKYQYDGEAKLSFVPGYHQNDTLYFTNAAKEVIAKTAVGNAAHNYAKFAFKMLSEANNEFVIETGIGYTDQLVKNNKGGWTTVKGEPKTGYLRWHNGNLVVTNNIEEAEHFTMAASKEEATSNDAVSTSEVSVVAGKGTVTVKGAAGKKVSVTNILGQTIANTVLTSDNVTISVPTGIVVVAVEGEEAIKVVVE